MFSKKHLVLALVMNGVLGMTTACAADVVDCHNAANQNREECVRVKVNINHHDDKVDCNNAANRSECVRTKANINHRNDVVNCRNAKSGNKDECLRAKGNYNH